jgi:hypothetical protein
MDQIAEWLANLGMSEYDPAHRRTYCGRANGMLGGRRRGDNDRPLE